MSNYISSNNNRFYAALEQSYGAAAASTEWARIPAVSLKARRQRERLQRKDKTGTRTFAGLPATSRYRTTFELTTYMAGLADAGRQPVHGAMFEAALGGAGMKFNGGAVAASMGTRVGFAAPHQLTPGQAVAHAGEIRFVAAVVDAATIQLNAPFSTPPDTAAQIRPSYTYLPGAEMKSATVMDFWSPETAVHRMLPGAVFDQMEMQVNGDFHEFKFTGSAADVVDSASFVSGQAGLEQFPAEPDTAGFDYTIVPGHLGQAWIGTVPTQFFTLASARVSLQNNAELRAREFGFSLPRAIAPGERDVRVDFAVYAQDDEQTKALYQAARQQSPMSVMLQLGQQDGQLCGIFLKSVIAETPEFDDGQTRLIWHFKNCRAQGTGDDEIAIAFA